MNSNREKLFAKVYGALTGGIIGGIIGGITGSIIVDAMGALGPKSPVCQNRFPTSVYGL